MQIGNESMDLRLTLIESAQCFQWQETPQGFIAVVQGKPVRLWKQGDAVFAQSDLRREQLRHYLDLERDYGRVAEQYAHIAPAKRAIEMYPALRVLNQDSWETLITFILSANNNVSRIRKLTDAISRGLGARFEMCGEEIWGLPTPEQLANCPESHLREMGVGYRAPYLIRTARMVADGFPLWELKNMSYDQAYEQLMRLPGVGDKVANCVLLFGCGHSSAFPVDVWVERLLKSWFDVTSRSRKAMMLAARDALGENAGLLQQFLFHAARTGDIEL